MFNRTELPTNMLLPHERENVYALVERPFIP